MATDATPGRMRHQCPRWAYSLLYCIIALLGALPAFAGVFSAPISSSQLDASAYSQCVDGTTTAMSGSPTNVLWTSDSSTLDTPVVFGSTKTIGARHLRIGFTSAQSIGTIIVKGNVTVSVLKSTATYPGTLTNDADWTTADRVLGSSAVQSQAGSDSNVQRGADEVTTWVLPSGTSTRAIRLTHTAVTGDYLYEGSVSGMHVLSGRYADVAPQAKAAASANLATAEIINNRYDETHAYLGWDQWGSYAPWKNGTNANAITETNAEWVMLVWPSSVSLRGLNCISAGFGSARVEYFTGAGTLNPREGKDTDWTPIAANLNVQQYAASDGAHQLGANWFDFGATVNTRAVRIRLTAPITETGTTLTGKSNSGKSVWLAEIQALQDLGTNAVSTSILTPSTTNAAVPITFTLASAGYVTLVIDDSTGTRVRNLVSEAYFPAGTNTVYWDGRDESLKVDESWGNYHTKGKLVAPATYTVRGLVRNAVTLTYEMSVNTAGNPPWMTKDFTGGWMADHGAPMATCFIPGTTPKVFVGSPAVEAGNGVTLLDLTGQQLWGMRSTGAGWYWAGADTAARDIGTTTENGIACYFIIGEKGKTVELWDFVNTDVYASTISSISRSGNIVTVTTTAAHDFLQGKLVEISGVVDKSFNGTFTVSSVPNSTSFTYAQTGANTTSSAGGCRHGNEGRYGFSYSSSLNLDTTRPSFGGVAVRNKLAAISLNQTDQIALVRVTDGHEYSKVTVSNPRGLAFDGNGKLWVLSGTTLMRYTVPTAQDGMTLIPDNNGQPYVTGFQDPRGLTIDLVDSTPTNDIYVTDWGTGQNASHQVKVYTSSGTFVRAIGAAGPVAGVGPYNANHMNMPWGITISKDGSGNKRLWVAENCYSPKCISRWTLTGTLDKAFYGPGTWLNGGGTLDPQDTTRFYAAQSWGSYALEYALNWTNHTATLQSLYGDNGNQILGFASGMVPVYVSGRQYMINTYGFAPEPSGTRYGANVGTITRMVNGIAMPVAAVGNAHGWPLLKTSPFDARWTAYGLNKDNTAQAVLFAWTDTDNDQTVDPSEVTLKAESGGVIPVFIGQDLAVMTGYGSRLTCSGFTANYAPIYDAATATRELTNFTPASYLQGGGEVFAASNGWRICTSLPYQGYQNNVLKWTYPNEEPGIQENIQMPLHTGGGWLQGSMRVLGPVFTPNIATGECFAVSGVDGQVYVMTVDGLFVSTLFQQDRLLPYWWSGSDKSFRALTATSGMDLTHTASLGYPNGFSNVMQAANGNVYVIGGVEATHIVRVDGLNSIARITPFNVTVSNTYHTANADYAATHEQERQQQGVGRETYTLTTPTTPIVVDGAYGDWPDDTNWVTIHEWYPGWSLGGKISGALTMDSTNLYGCFKAPWGITTDNSATEWQHVLRNGWGIVINLGTNAAADPARTAPVQGDLKLVICKINGTTKAVLYRQVATGGTSHDFTNGVRTVTMQDVTDISSQVTLNGFEFSVPFSALGWTPTAGSAYLGDFGMLFGRGTPLVTYQAEYWNNNADGVLYDEPYEVQCYPQTWGRLVVGGNASPIASLAYPPNGATFIGANNLTLRATAGDPDGTITKVEFWTGTATDGTLTKVSEDSTAPYSYTWSGFSTGTYTVSACAVDNLGARSAFSTATVTFAATPSQGTGSTPTCSLSTTPAGGSTVVVPGDTVTMTATASNTDGVSRVEFFVGAERVATDSSSAYSYGWTPVTGGSYTLTARAFGPNGKYTTSSSVSMTVKAKPSVVIATPLTNTAYGQAPATIEIKGVAGDNDGTISQVEFFNGATSLGVDSTAPYNYTWTNVQPGTYTVTAVAKDNENYTTTSSAITVKVAEEAQAEYVSTDTTTKGSFWSSGGGYVYGSKGYALPSWNSGNDVTDLMAGSGGFLSAIKNLNMSGYHWGWTSDTRAPVLPGNGARSAACWNNDSGDIKISLTDAADPTWHRLALYVVDWDLTTRGMQIDILNMYTGASLLSEPVNALDYNGGKWVIFNFRGNVKVHITNKGTNWPTISAVCVDDTVNRTPQIEITAPTTGQLVAEGSNVTISANASDPDGTITKVEFYANGTLINTDSASPYSYIWSNVRGDYLITAKAYEATGLTNSDSVSFTAATTAFSDNFNDGTINAAWTMANGTWSETGGVLRQTDGSTYNVFKKAMVNTMTTAPDDQMIVAKMRVDSWTQDYCSRLGVALQVDPSTIDGYTLFFLYGNNDVRLTTPSWGGPNAYPWTTNTWHWFKLKRQGDTIYGKVWLDGTTEPLTWPYSATVTSRANFLPALDGGAGYCTASFDDVTVYQWGVKPQVSLTSPTEGQSYSAGTTNITLNATASVADGTINRVEFYRGNALLGTDSTSPYSYTWTGATEGAHPFSAKVYDNAGGNNVSTVVNATVAITSIPTTNLRLWMKADSILGQIDNSAATTWYDSSGQKNHAIQGTSASQPTFKANSWGDLPAVQFDGSSDFMSIANASSMQLDGDNMTFVAIGSFSNWTNNNYQMLLSKGNITTDLNYAFGKSDTNKLEFVYYDTWWRHVYDSGTFGATNNQTYVLSWVVSKSAKTVSFYVNGTLQSTVTDASHLNYSGNSATGAFIGSNSAGGDLFNGKIGEMVLYGSALSSTDRQTVETYLTNKYLNQARAVYVDTDTSTQGDWWTSTGGYTYGGAGYVLPYWNGSTVTNLTGSFVSSVTSNGNSYLWSASPTSDTRAPINPATSTRSAACWYSGGTEDINVTLADPNDPSYHYVRLYCLDWEPLARSLTIDILDPTTNASYLAAPVTLSTLNNGKWVTFKFRGNIKIRLTNTSSWNCVVSAIAFDTLNTRPSVALTAPANNSTVIGPSVTLTATASDTDGTISKVEFYQGTTKLGEDSTSPYSYTWTNASNGSYNLTAKAFDDDGATQLSTSASVTVVGKFAQYITTDTTTQGNWWSQSGGHVYGSKGYVLFHWNGSTVTDLKSGSGGYVNDVAASGFGSYLWTAAPASDTRALYNPNTNTRSAACWTSGSTPAYLTVNVTDSTDTTYRYLRLYFLDNDRLGRSTSIDILDADTDTSLLSSTVTLNNYGEGKWVTFKVRGRVKVKIVDLGGVWSSTISAITFDDYTPLPPSVNLTAPTDGTSITAGSNITLEASASSIDSTISKVEFYQGSTKLGEDSTSPYSYTWTNIPANNYTLTAKAYDNISQVTTSSSIAFYALAREATYISTDTTTQGSWWSQGGGYVYGTDGYVLCNWNSADVVSLSGSAISSVTASGFSNYQWSAPPVSDGRATMNPATNTRAASCWYTGGNGDITVTLASPTDTDYHYVRLYCLDWDRMARTMTIDVLDPTTNTSLLGTPVNVDTYGDGKWVKFRFKGSIKIRMTNTCSWYGVLSAIAFDDN